MLFSELYKIMVNKVTFVGFTGAIAPAASLAPPLQGHDEDITPCPLKRGKWGGGAFSQ